MADTGFWKTFIAAVFIVAHSGSSALAEDFSISGSGSVTTKLGPATKVRPSTDKAQVTLQFTDGKDKLVTRCQNVKTIMKGATDLTFLKSMLVPTKPILRISLNIFLPEADPAWKALIEQTIASDKSTSSKLDGVGAPFRPSVLEVGIDFDVDSPNSAELELTQPEFQAIQASLQVKREELRTNGFATFEVTSVLLPCLILDKRVKASVSVLGRSFDRVQTKRILAETDVQSLVRRSEDQIAKDNNPIGYVNEANLRSFLYFRSVESIGSWAHWLEKERIVYWEKFVDEWAKRLAGKFRPLADDELKSVGQVLTSVSREAVLFEYGTGTQSVIYKE